MTIETQENLEAINSFYDLKNKYESKLLQEKKKIILNTQLSKKEKRDRFLRIKKKCINCKKEGGTIFSMHNKVLKAVCGAVGNPCKLDIEIQLGRFIKSDNIVDILKEQYDDLKKSIIETKLNLLFNYVNEDAAVETFDKYVEELENTSDLYKNTLTNYLLVTNNPTKAVKLTEEEIKMFHYIEEYKSLIKQYEDGSRDDYLMEAMDLYNSKIMPTVETIRTLKFSYNAVEKDGTTEFAFDDYKDVYELIQSPYTLEDIQFSIGKKTQIIKNTR
jgi:hypothetical protein